MTPNLALALEDFVPVLLTLLALVWLTRMVYQMNRRSGSIALVGSILVVLGGGFKATEKLIWAISGNRVLWMDASLFLLMAPGFALLAWSIWCGQRAVFDQREPRLVWQTPLTFVFFIGGGSFFTSDSTLSRPWFFVLLTLVVVMSCTMLILLSRHAWHYRLKGPAVLFLLYLVLILVLNGLARTPSPTIGVEWTKQLLNTAATGILAFASWRLWVGVKRNGQNL